MKIYTKQGDQGNTQLWGESGVSKADLRITAIGNVDELNAYLGILPHVGLFDDWHDMVREVQGQLFSFGAELACASEKTREQLGDKCLSMAAVEALEQCIDALQLHLAPLRNFILPGGSALAAHMHVARTLCRRAERSVVMMHQQQPLRDVLLVYLNRLSDWLFVLARAANH